MQHTEEVCMTALDGSRRCIVIKRENQGGNVISFTYGQLCITGSNRDDPDEIMRRLASVMGVDVDILSLKVMQAMATMELHRITDLLLS